MKIAVLGATSFIAQELIREWVTCQARHEVHLYARDVSKVAEFIGKLDASSVIAANFTLASFPNENFYDAVINFIGVGDPSKAQAMASTILDVTFYYDDLVIQYLKDNQKCKYIFLSSGAAYGSDYSEPATINKKACFDINNIQQSEKYGLAKLITEVKHRSLGEYQICDLRVFNYFSRYQNMNARFFITDIFRALNDCHLCEVSSEPMVRDYLHPKDFCQIIDRILSNDNINMAADCYSLGPVDKHTLLTELENRYGLKWCYTQEVDVINATGNKKNYYSKYHVLSRIGYTPVHTSLSGIFEEFDSLLRG